MTEADPFKGLSGAGPDLVRPGAVEQQRQTDVVGGGERRQQVEELEDETDPPPAPKGEVIVRHRGEGGALEQHVAGGGPVQARHDVQQRRLAGAGWAGDDEEVTGIDGQGDAPEGTDGLLATAVGAVDVPQFHEMRRQLGRRLERQGWLRSDVTWWELKGEPATFPEVVESLLTAMPSAGENRLVVSSVTSTLDWAT